MEFVQGFKEYAYETCQFIDCANFLANVAATVVGGVILTFLFFLMKERVFPLPEISGQWFYQQRTQESSYEPYRGMVLTYVAIIWREGNLIYGSIEKIYEKTLTNEIEYIGEYRTRGQITGYVAKKYLSKDKIIIHIEEEGDKRTSTTFHNIEYIGEKMKGDFVSMVAEQRGVTEWQRESY